MRDYSIIGTNFWSSPFFKKISGDPILVTLSLYLNAHPDSNMIGVFPLRVPEVCRDLGFTRDQVLRGFKQFQRLGFALYDLESEEIYLNNYAPTQMGYLSKDAFSGLKAQDNRVKAVVKQWGQIRSIVLKTLFYRFYREKFHLPKNWTPEERLRQICVLSEPLNPMENIGVTMRNVPLIDENGNLSFEKIYYETLLAWQKKNPDERNLFRNIFDDIFFPSDADEAEKSCYQDFSLVREREKAIRMNEGLEKQDALIEALARQNIGVNADTVRQAVAEAAAKPQKKPFEPGLFDEKAAPIPPAATPKQTQKEGVFEPNEKELAMIYAFHYRSEEISDLVRDFVKTEGYKKNGRGNLIRYLRHREGALSGERFREIGEYWNQVMGPAGGYNPEKMRSMTENLKKKMGDLWRFAQEYATAKKRRLDPELDHASPESYADKAETMAWIKILIDEMKNDDFYSENAQFSILFNKIKIERFMSIRQKKRSKQQQMSANSSAPNRAATQVSTSSAVMGAHNILPIK